MKLTIELDSLDEIPALVAYFSQIKPPEPSLASDDPRGIPIQALRLNARTENCLKAEGYKTVGDVLKGTKRIDLLKVPNFSRNSLKLWDDEIARLGIEHH